MWVPRTSPSSRDQAILVGDTAVGEEVASRSGRGFRPIWDSPTNDHPTRSSVVASNFFGISGTALAGKSIDAAKFADAHSIFESDRKGFHDHPVPSSFESCEYFVHFGSI